MAQLTLLLAEDDPNWMSLGAKAFRALGYGVEEAADGKKAISALSSGRYSHRAVVSDLHMGGNNGEIILDYLLKQQLNIPFIISSGTLADDAKRILTEGVPSVRRIGKEDFLNPESLRIKLEDILKSPVHNHPSPDYLSALKKAEDSITAIPEILVEANRIKGRVFSLINRFGQDLGDDYLLLKEFQYHGRTPTDTVTNLHELKNMLTGMAHNRYKHNESVHRQLLRISDDIIQVINRPREDSMNLGEIVARLSENFGRIYSISVQNDVPKELRIKNPGLYSKVLYFLIENAVIAALEYNSNEVRIGYDEKTKSLQIINAGMFPAESLLPAGKPHSGIKSTREFGTGFGIKNCVQSLDELGQGLTYLNDDGCVYTNIGLNLSWSAPTSIRQDAQKPKVLFLEYGGDYQPRLTGIENMIRLLNPSFEYVWDTKLNQSSSLIKGLKLEEFFLVICHPELGAFSNSSNLSVLLSLDVLSRMPDARYGFITATPRHALNGSISARYDIAELDNEIKKHARPGTELKKGGILPYIDFLERGLPSSDQLNILIEKSYQKYMAAAKIQP